MAVDDELQRLQRAGSGTHTEPVRRPASAQGGAAGRWWRQTLDDAVHRSPARLALSVFALVVLLFTGLLSLPMATATGERAPFVDALFTATSAVCVTGLTVVDTATYWSGFGQGVVLVGMKVGGLGILTLASLLGLAVAGRLGLRQRLLAQTETKASRLSEVQQLLAAVVLASTACEVVTALVLFPRFVLEGEGVLVGAYHAVFYGVSAFNNAGFVVHEGGLSRWASDPAVLLPIALSVFIGSMGFPVILALMRNWRRPATWSLHTKLTLTTSSLLLVASMVLIGTFEWTNPATLGGQSGGTKALTTFFTAVMPRSGGFSTVDVGEMREATWLVTDVLMFIGGGSASTAGGIKVTTFAVLVLAFIAEARGDDDVDAFGRRIPAATQRLAITVLLAGSAMVTVATTAMLEITGLTLDVVLFEVVSAFATVGLSTGITADLPDSGKYVLTALMYAGRTGTITLAAALAVRESRRLYRRPEERPIVG